MLILLSTIFFKNSTLNSAVVDIAMCSTSLEGCSLEATSLMGCSRSFKAGRVQSGPLTALIGYLNVLLEYFDFFKFSLAGNLGGFPETPGNPPRHAPMFLTSTAITIPNDYCFNQNIAHVVHLIVIVISRFSRLVLLTKSQLTLLLEIAL